MTIGISAHRFQSENSLTLAWYHLFASALHPRSSSITGEKFYSFPLIREEGHSMKKRFTERLITFALRQAAHGIPVSEITRKKGHSEQTFPAEEAVHRNGRL